MKKTLMILSATLLLTNCGNDTGMFSKIDAPTWFVEPYKGYNENKYILGVGISNKLEGLNDIQVQMDEAKLNAKSNIAEQIATEIVKDAVKNFSKTKNQTNSAFEDTLKIQIKEKVQQTLYGVGSAGQYLGKDGTVYVRLKITKESAKESLKKSELSSYQNAIDRVGVVNNTETPKQN